MSPIAEARQVSDPRAIDLEVQKHFAEIMSGALYFRLASLVFGTVALVSARFPALALFWTLAYGATVLSSAFFYRSLGTDAARLEADKQSLLRRETLHAFLLTLLAVVGAPYAPREVLLCLTLALLCATLIADYAATTLPELFLRAKMPVCIGLAIALLAFPDTTLLPWVGGAALAFGLATRSMVRAAGARRRAGIALRFEMMQARDEADRANRAKSTFIASMSHELRTPLNAILGFSEIIRHQALGPVGSPKYLEYAGDIHASGQHLLNLINDILDLSKIESGKMELRIAAVNLSDVLAESLRVLTPKILQKRLEVINALGDDAWSMADERAVKQVLINVLSNAFKYTPEDGRVRIDLYTDGEDRPVVTVTDTGPGMSEEFLTRAFHPFEQGDNMYDRERGSSGLGLAVVKGLMTAQGGTVVLDSEKGKGTTVRLTFRNVPERAARQPVPLMVVSAKR